ncbi:hypothetical protein LTR36_001418 [Oleoguttula mirabilis]|uniref:Peptidase C19 ubiquitin carboxyl-terminal hydrolase domain-containing protein n=1 Tax=Oleoguttula mirabilis TaxID=1507867 RepID=A0AAV9JP67_9PEZI|nr:hypothetical protein LTR36_001418 [Oleoguttula mirabilis]
MAQMSDSSGSGAKSPAGARKRPAEDSDIEKPPPKRSRPREACFSNAAIHFIDASLSNAHVSRLHGDDGTRPNSFGVREKDCLKNKQLMQELKDKIKDAADKGVLSLSAHLGQLLKDFRSTPADADHHEPTEHSISPFMLQRVFAYSKLQRNELDGDVKHDSSEWLLAVLQEVFEETPSLRALFEVKQLIQDLITDALRADKLPNDYACEGCKRLGTSEKLHTYTDLPDNLIVLIDRIEPETQQKKTTRIGLEFEDVFVDAERYRMTAFRNRQIKTGHYTAFRKHEDKWWELDDASVTPATERDMADTRNHQSCFLLLQKVKQ